MARMLAHSGDWARKRRDGISANKKRGKMQVKNPKQWKATRDTNLASSDPYNHDTIRFAEKWADLSEAEMAKGTPFDVAVKTMEHRTGIKITGAQLDAVKSILREDWAHGAQFARTLRVGKPGGGDGKHSQNASRTSIDVGGAGTAGKG